MQRSADGRNESEIKNLEIKTMKIKSSTAIIAALAFSTTAAFATVFITDTIIAVSNPLYDDQPIVVSNCTLTVNGPHSFASLQVISNGVVTHTAAPNGEAGNLVSLTIAGDLGLDTLSRIDVSSRGYAANAGPGASSFFQAEDGIRDTSVTGVQTCALPISFSLTMAPQAALPGRSRVTRS